MLSAARFEEELNKDPVLREEFELFQSVDKALADTEVIDLRMKLNELHSEILETTRVKTKSRYQKLRYASYAATIAIIIGFTLMKLLSVGDANRIFEKYYQPYEVTSINRSGAVEADISILKAMEKYQNRQYREAVLMFEKILDKDPGQMATRFYSGISYMEIEEYKKAGNSFSLVIDHKNNLYIEQAEWFLGFCYLKTEEKEKAIKQFAEIAESNSFYSEKARKILKKLQ